MNHKVYHIPFFPCLKYDQISHHIFSEYESFGQHTKWLTMNWSTPKWSTTKWLTLSSPNGRHQIYFDCQLVYISMHGSSDFEASKYAVIFNEHLDFTQSNFRPCFFFGHIIKPEKSQNNDSKGVKKAN